MGTIAVKLPLPPGALPTLLRQDERFKASYLEHFAGFYSTSDAGVIDEARSEMVKGAQEALDAWQPNEDGLDDELGGGGIFRATPSTPVLVTGPPSWGTIPSSPHGTGNRRGFGCAP
jgi:hypothetical protein